MTIRLAEASDILAVNSTFQGDNLSDALLQKYNTSGPRYTSYPTAPVWTEDFGADAYRKALTTRASSQEAARLQQSLSIYTHLPFCEARCLFCGCNVVITQQREQAEKYLGYLFQELEQTAELLANNDSASNPVLQFHWGGGTPTYLSPEQMDRLFRFQTRLFPLAQHAEIAIEVDPRVTTPEHVQVLKELGFNRVSMGVQDVDPKVQEAIHRIQPTQMTENLMRQCHEAGIDSLNIDLIYGLPYQSAESFGKTLDVVIQLNPDRIALYNYAHVPWISPHQQAMPESALPDGPEKFRIFRLALHRLTAAGYQYIGMDHFAKPQDELSQALQHGTLHRNFMGYTVLNKASELLGFGVSAISGLSSAYAQNQKKLSRYYEALDAGTLPTLRGMMLSDEDQLRRQVILDILCKGQLCFADYRPVLEEAGKPIFTTYFASACQQLQAMAEDGLLNLTDEGFKLTPLGRIFSRNIAMPFDAYLSGQTTDKPLFSKTL